MSENLTIDITQLDAQTLKMLSRARHRDMIEAQSSISELVESIQLMLVTGEQGTTFSFQTIFMLAGEDIKAYKKLLADDSLKSPLPSNTEEE